MIRFYKSYLGRALLGLLILIELEKATDKQTVADQVRKWQAPDPSTAQTVELLLDNYTGASPDESPSNEDVLKGAFGQLQKRRNDDVDLLNLIVNALKLPFTSSFGPNALKTLREAVLTPSEITDLKKTYRSVAKCNCGHEFTTNEMVSATVGNDVISLRCTKCSRPQVARCDYCGNIVQLLGKIGVGCLKEIDCGCRKKAERAAGKQPPSTSPTSVHQAIDVAASMRQLIREQTRSYRNATQPSASSGGYIPYPTAPFAPLVPGDADDDDGGF